MPGPLHHFTVTFTTPSGRKRVRRGTCRLEGAETTLDQALTRTLAASKRGKAGTVVASKFKPARTGAR